MWLYLLLLALLWPFGFSHDNQPDLPYGSNVNPNRELCWERCFQIEDNDLERFREIYDDFYKMGMEARRLKNMYGVNGTVILLDSTLSSINPINWSGAQPGPNYNLPPLEQGESTADEIWEFQKNLAAITTMVMGSDDEHNPLYLMQFDENGAKTCEEFQCLHSCEADYIMDTELDKPNTNNDEDGKIEVGCHMSKEYVCSTPCNAYIANEMAISFLNSGIEFKRSLHEDFSSEEDDAIKKLGNAPCISHYNTRMAIGTHLARWEDLDKWSSKAARPFYFHDNKLTMNAATALRSCLRTRCCPIEGDFYLHGITGDVCKKSVLENGYDIVNSYDHSAYGSN